MYAPYRSPRAPRNASSSTLIAQPPAAYRLPCAGLTVYPRASRQRVFIATPQSVNAWHESFRPSYIIAILVTERFGQRVFLDVHSPDERHEDRHQNHQK